ncbi:hypothetical protein JCM9279_001701 [Rhodotorula babjevae]
MLILVYTKTAGYYHESIPTASAAIARMGAESGAFNATVSNDEALFTDDGLAPFRLRRSSRASSCRRRGGAPRSNNCPTSLPPTSSPAPPPPPTGPSPADLAAARIATAADESEQLERDERCAAQGGPPPGVGADEAPPGYDDPHGRA